MTQPEPSDLVTWLRAQLDDDERIANAALAAKETGIPSHLDDEDRIVIGDRAVNVHATAHIIRHGPARVLADVAAKRAILELHGKASPPGWSSPEHRRVFGSWCPRCVAEELPYDQGVEYEPWPCSTLRLLALPYADRPGYYLDEWRPVAPA